MKTVKPSKARAFAKELNLTDSCRNGESPMCTSACPYGLDVRGLMRKLQRGSFRGAYGVLAEQLTFPRVLCSVCGGACQRGCEKQLEASPVPIPALEQAVFAYSGKSTPPRFNVPPKTEKIAVVGAGLCGITCAYVLTTLGYSVSLYEKNAEIGGRLAEILSAEEYLPEIMSVIESDSLAVFTGHAVSDISEMSEFAAVLLATGAGDSALGFAGKKLPDNVFAAGELVGTTLPQASQSGRSAAVAIDAFLKIGTKNEINIPTDSVPVPVEKTPEYELLTKEQVQAEAKGCRMCDCRGCFDICDMMQFYKTMPAKIESDVRVTLNPVDCFMPRRATRIINSCNDCGMCRDVCPEKIDVNYMLMTSRTLMCDDGSLPKVYHDIWLRDFEFSLSDKAAYLKKPDCGYLFFPGCQLGASSPEYVKDAYALLCKAKPGAGLLLNCCGIPAKWAGEAEMFAAHLEKLREIWESCGRPVIVTACPTCKRTFKESLPDIPVTSLYELLDESGYSAPDEAEGRIAVFHPCSSRRDTKMQESVKALISKCGLEANEIENPLERNRCCGYGGHIYPANRELFDIMAEKRAAADPLPYITYCANCRDALTGKGKNCRHIIEVLTGKSRANAAPPTLNLRRLNRIAVREFYSGEAQSVTPVKLIISDELRAFMEQSLIGDYDIEDVIKSCEETKSYLITERGSKIGHLKIRTVTYWAEWCEEDGAYRILNAYCHRMTIEGESADE